MVIFANNTIFLVNWKRNYKTKIIRWNKRENSLQYTSSIGSFPEYIPKFQSEFECYA